MFLKVTVLLIYLISYISIPHKVIAASYQILYGMAYQSLGAISHYVLKKIFSHTHMDISYLS
jgi:hypothetical protein